ncbi:hypothetical protein [Paracoccus onubensis]|uniref:Uncharacterized protein n=1 Tax=Paracoccus onubensis TaxID=1675788 RepID=A0A418T8I9_9RHOB|nr:hypothetical protein [Paracoccus onubensis]RJE89487.1 hypothetical protein D3P04_02350 [Paracoccus onubensis]
MTIAEGAAGTVATNPVQDTVQIENLFEHAAIHAQQLPENPSPAQLGSQVMQSLQGFAQRSMSLSERSQALLDHAGTSSAQFVSLQPGQDVIPPSQPPTQNSVQDSQLDRAIDSLSLMFDHAIETQLVVRGATQVAGAANTLLRGQ